MNEGQPGLHREAKRKINEIPSQERRMIYNLSNAWFISFIRATQFKGSSFIFAFAKPTSVLREKFHLDREVLIIFSNYTRFEPRTLDFVDKTMFEFQARLDKLFFILISGDKKIKEKIKDMTMMEKESRLIVPFTYDELIEHKEEEYIATRLKEIFYTRDLFAVESPLRSDTYFYGRAPMVQYLYDRYKSGENAGLFGLRRIGKTSVLFALSRFLSLRGEPSIFLDCSETSFHQRRWHESLGFIIDNMRRKFPLSKNIRLHNESDYTEKDASRCFEEDLRAIFDQLNKGRILISLDEIENITFDLSPSSHWAKGKDFIFFWQAIRSIFQKNRDLFSFVIAGVNPKCIETPSALGFDNPIYRLITPKYLGFFDQAQVREMVSSIGKYMGLQLEEEVYTYLTEDYGGHPFLIRQACSYLHNSSSPKRPTTITKFRYREEKEKIDRSLSDYIDLILNVLQTRYQNEYDVLQYLSIGDVQTFKGFVAESHSYIEHLEGYGLITEEDGNYYFRIKAVETYLHEKSQQKKRLLTKDEKWREIASRRSKLEMELRKIIKQTLKSNFGAARAKDELLAAINKQSQRDKLRALNLDDIFSGDGTMSELYFRDLTTVILNHWREFRNIFANDKTNFEIYARHINRFRIDAHANDISDTNLGTLLIALQWLQERVNEFLA
jgi:hypothetical protein